MAKLEDEFEYAMAATQVLRVPRRSIDTLGSSLVHYHLVTAHMDLVDVCFVREGKMEAERPRIVTPTYMAKILLDGFGAKAQEYVQYLAQHSREFVFLRYGFRMRKEEVECYEVREPLEVTLERVEAEVEAKGDPLAAIVVGVDDAWEISLVKFMLEYVRTSFPQNLEDFRKRGWL
ncbi:hypothetical protein [Candidatus Methylacidithermus pantelleriae]|uniref:Uncharacterized protein n=1 Tax=Candidatus Methylacidithermus pantelleriae TaxID=2744239 RepID=A0A8J2BL04_9BACT|nr:hypothetical protein [Candidatus Methylacidithermus pantelleriae]CAF0703880.1 conserved hypothetical protein [Candidatus Methylacidithermus pantelleriae]